MSEKYIVRLPWGEESLPSKITQKGFRWDVGMAFMDWKRGESILKGKHPEFRLFSVVDGKKGPLVGRVVFYDPFPVWFDAKGRAYAYKRDGTLADRIPDEVIRRS